MAYCRNCGSELFENSTVCPRCGTARGAGVNFCPNCGKPTNPAMSACPECGVYLQNIYANVVPNQKSRLAAGLLGIFLGTFGVHNFYLGYTAKAVIQLVLTLLSCCMCAPITSIWGLVEGILILCGNISVDGRGNPLGE